eukprot:1027284-Prorocentrum_minimum.AAC.1
MVQDPWAEVIAAQAKQPPTHRQPAAPQVPSTCSVSAAASAAKSARLVPSQVDETPTRGAAGPSLADMLQGAMDSVRHRGGAKRFGRCWCSCWSVGDAVKIPPPPRRWGHSVLYRGNLRTYGHTENANNTEQRTPLLFT